MEDAICFPLIEQMKARVYELFPKNLWEDFKENDASILFWPGMVKTREDRKKM